MKQHYEDASVLRHDDKLSKFKKKNATGVNWFFRNKTTCCPNKTTKTKTVGARGA